MTTTPKGTTVASLTTEEARTTFIDNLQSMASGSYLRDEDKEFWEPPYPEDVVKECATIVDAMIDRIGQVAARSAEEQVGIAQAAGITVHDGDSTEGGEEDDDVPDTLSAAIAAAIVVDIRRLAELSHEHEDALLEDCLLYTSPSPRD